jgi:hypothetical protein
MAAQSRAKPVRRGRRPPKLTPPVARRGRRLPPGLTRLDYPKVRGYIVRIGYIRTKTGWKPKFKGYFSDARYGSKAKARAAAEVWRATLLRTGRPPKAPVGQPRRRATRSAA